MFLTHPVPPSLACGVDLLWYSESYDAPHTWERVLPSGRSQLVIELAEGSAPPEFERLRTEVILVETTRMSDVIGVVMRPGTAPFAPDVERHALRDRLQEGPSAADQAHLTHEFRRFSGLTPAAFVASHRPHANHVVAAD